MNINGRRNEFLKLPIYIQNHITYDVGVYQMIFCSLICQNVNSALTLDHTKEQYVYLGFHTDICMTRPETCGAAGGAISVWINLIGCTHGGIISTLVYDSSGSVIACSDGSFRYYQCISLVREGRQWFQSLALCWQLNSYLNQYLTVSWRNFLKTFLSSPFKLYFFCLHLDS